jgi:hypothetical protein
MIKSFRRSRSSTSASTTPYQNTPPGLDLRIEHDQILIMRDDRQYRIRGLEQNQSPVRLTWPSCRTNTKSVTRP